MNNETTYYDEPTFFDHIQLSDCDHHEIEVNGHTICGDFFEDELIELMVTKTNDDNTEETVHHFDNVQGPLVSYEHKLMGGDSYLPFIKKDYEIKVPQLPGKTIKISMCDDKLVYLYLCSRDRNGNEEIIGGQFPSEYISDDTVKN